MLKETGCDNVLANTAGAADALAGNTLATALSAGRLNR
jgi:hypothetical protein